MHVCVFVYVVCAVCVCVVCVRYVCREDRGIGCGVCARVYRVLGV